MLYFRTGFPDRDMRHLQHLQHLYYSVCHCSDRRPYLLRFADSLIHPSDCGTDQFDHGTFPARVPHPADHCRHGGNFQFARIIRTFPADALFVLCFPVLQLILPRTRSLSGCRSEQDSLGDDALFRDQSHPAYVYLRPGLYAGKDIRLFIYNHAGGTVEYQFGYSEETE